MATPDRELLRAFAEQADEAAFAELVRRRIDFVYGCALRQMRGDAHRAADIAQEVFTALARKAQVVSEHASLLGWLCTATRFAAIDVIRREEKRKVREREALLMHNVAHAQPVDWSQLQPVIDAALSELSVVDRDAVLARFFDRQSFADIARDNGVTENAAQKRVERALEKLRVVLARHKVTSTTAALGLVLANLPGVAAPMGLASSVAQAAVSGAAGGGAIAAVAGWSLAQYGALATMVAATGLGLWMTVVGGRAEQDAQMALVAARQTNASLVRQVRALEQREQSTAERLQAAERTNRELKAQPQRSESVESTVSAPTDEPISEELVFRRFKLAQDLVRSGDPAAALKELLWCYDVGLPRTGGGPVRTTSLMMFARLGERYPPAIEAIRERREKARQRVRAGETGHDVIGEYAALNKALKEEAESIALFDSLPPGDSRRRALAHGSYDYLIEQRRYREAAETRNAGSMISVFERMVGQPPPQDRDLESYRRELRETVVTQAAKDIEVLAGAGDLTQARAYATRVLEFDGSDATRALLQRHATRAGQPNLLGR